MLAQIRGGLPTVLTKPTVIRPCFIAALAAAISASALSAQEPASPEPEPITPSALFAAHDLLEFSLHAPWKEVRDDRKDGAEERPAELRFSDGSAALPLQVRTRGNFRLRRSNCPALPPIRLNFAGKEVVGSVFEGQDKLKLVTHCRSRDSDEQNLLQEYLAYRVFNELTPASLSARLVRISYVDSERPDEEYDTKYAFIIEAEEAFAARMGGEILEVPQVHPADYDRDSMLRVALFEYMVGNTDWSLVEFHNVILLRTADMVAHPVPYDFDWTGLVNAPYAEPAESVRIRSVRDRIYRGYCIDGLDYQGVAADFREKRSSVLALVDGIPGMTDDTKRESQRYLEEFFDVLEDPEEYDRDVVRRCRKLG